jgi:hypothetical protein
MAAKFPLGRVIATPGALRAMERAHQGPLAFLARHQAGDWGDIDPEDAGLNDRSLIDGTRLLSAYTLKTGVKIWLITEADRSQTTFLLPEEY